MIVDQTLELSGITIEKTVKMMRLSFSRILLQHPEVDITIDQWIIIQILHQYNGLSQQQLGELTFKDAPTITRMIDLLVANGLVAKDADANDRRKFKLSLTDNGRKGYALVAPLVRQFRQNAYDGITEYELKALENALNKIFENLSK
ncbi:MAG: MarR family transcriptional regulator [Saprospiraceae bacterium]